MWPHEIVILWKWYTFIGLVLVGFGFCVITDDKLKYTRYRFFAGPLLALNLLLVVPLSGIMMIIFGRGHLVGILFFYLYLSVAVMLPLVGFRISRLRRGKGPEDDPDVLSVLLAQALASKDTELARDLLGRFRKGMEVKDPTPVIDALCSVNDAIRKAAAPAAVAIGMDSRIGGWVRGKQKDFELLARSGDSRMVKSLCRAALHPHNPSVGAAWAVLEIADLPDYPDSRPSDVFFLFRECSTRSVLPSLVMKLVSMKKGAVICGNLLRERNEERLKFLVEALFEKMVEGGIMRDPDWQDALVVFREEGHVRFVLEEVAKSLCSELPQERQRMAALAPTLGLNAGIVDAVPGDSEDLMRLAALKKSWILSELVRVARADPSEHAVSAMIAIVAVLREGWFPEDFAAALCAQNGSGTIKTDAFVPVGWRDADGEQMVAISREIKKGFQAYLSTAWLSLLVSLVPGIRVKAASIAEDLGMALAIRDAVRGERSDFERLGELGDSRFVGSLQALALKAPRDTSEAAAKGLVAYCHSGKVPFPASIMEEVAIKGPQGAQEVAIEGILDLEGPKATYERFLNLLKHRDNEMRRRAAKALAVCATRMKSSMGGLMWEELRALVNTPHTDRPGSHEDGFHCDYNRGCQMQGIDPHTDTLVDSGDFYRAHRVNNRFPHVDRGIGLTLPE